MFAYFKYFSYLCSVINERLHRGCRKPERVGKNEIPKSYERTQSFIEDLENRNLIIHD